MPPWVEREVVASHLLDVAGAWGWLSGTKPTLDAGRVPTEVTSPTARELVLLQAPAVPPRAPAICRGGNRPTRWVATPEALTAACSRLGAESVLGLDVETTIASHGLCLVQLATSHETVLVDVLALPDLDPLAELLADPGVTKVIHNAAFERKVLGRYGIAIDRIVDTLTVSKQRRGSKLEGGHSLEAVCERELDLELDKGEQCSDWSQRPLTDRQIDYAARDVEVLLQLYEHFGEPAPEPTNLSRWEG